MIEKIYKNNYMATCDNCGTGQECDNWADVMEFMREEGWKKKLVVWVVVFEKISTENGSIIALSAGRSKNHDTQSEIHTQRQEPCTHQLR